MPGSSEASDTKHGIKPNDNQTNLWSELGKSHALPEAVLNLIPAVAVQCAAAPAVQNLELAAANFALPPDEEIPRALKLCSLH